MISKNHSGFTLRWALQIFTSPGQSSGNKYFELFLNQLAKFLQLNVLALSFRLRKLVFCDWPEKNGECKEGDKESAGYKLIWPPSLHRLCWTLCVVMDPPHLLETKSCLGQVTKPEEPADDRTASSWCLCLEMCKQEKVHACVANRLPSPSVPAGTTPHRLPLQILPALRSRGESGSLRCEELLPIICLLVQN